MSVSHYNNSACTYSILSLKKVIYLVPSSDKEIHVDGGDCYIENLDDSAIIQIDGFNISLNEETSLDERYEFHKVVSLSMHGFVPRNTFGDRYYVILQSEDGTLWFVNPDFPARITYQYNLNGTTNQTDYTFELLSNYPTLRLDDDINPTPANCIGYNLNGIEALKLLEKDYCELQTASGLVTTFSKEFQNVKFLKNTCSFTSQFDGFNVTDTITFQIGFDAYKTSWQYNLLEFMTNKYASILTPKMGIDKFYVGFNSGMYANYQIQASSNVGESDIVTITLIETSPNGFVASSGVSESASTDTDWAFVPTEYECVGDKTAEYLLQEGYYLNGLSKDEYLVLEGHENDYPDLNIIGTFSSGETFNTKQCVPLGCQITTDMPLNIQFDAITCNTYSLYSDCDWEITDIPSFVSVSPTSGSGQTSYSVSVCSLSSITASDYFNIESGGNVKVVNVTIIPSDNYIRPTSVDINCLEQNVTFNYNSDCYPSAITSDYTYQVTNSQITFNVPSNTTTSARTTQHIVYDCNGEPHTLTINQDKVYEDWVNTSDYLCESGDSYVKQQRYTGTTSTSINTPTLEYRKGAMITSGDSRCMSTQTRWIEASDYICISGDKWSYEKEQISYSYDGGVTWSAWSDTGQTRPKTMTESGSTDCQETITYEWRLTELWQCEE